MRKTNKRVEIDKMLFDVTIIQLYETIVKSAVRQVCVCGGLYELTHQRETPVFDSDTVLGWIFLDSSVAVIIGIVVEVKYNDQFSTALF